MLSQSSWPWLIIQGRLHHESQVGDGPTNFFQLLNHTQINNLDCIKGTIYVQTKYLTNIRLFDCLLNSLLAKHLDQCLHSEPPNS